VKTLEDMKAEQVMHRITGEGVDKIMICSYAPKCADTSPCIHRGYHWETSTECKRYCDRYEIKRRNSVGLCKEC
jgi:hypothetical protein